MRLRRFRWTLVAMTSPRHHQDRSRMGQRQSLQRRLPSAPAVAVKHPFERPTKGFMSMFHHRLENGRRDGPFNLEASDSWLCADISDEAFERDLGGWCGFHFLVVVLRVLIVPHADELLVSVRAGQDEGGDAKDVF